MLAERIGSRSWALILCIALLGLAFQGERGLWEPDEGRYVAVALNMLATGDYVVPRLDRDHPHYAKPPLTYWAIAASIAAFGRTEWAARLPSALAYMLTALAVAALGATIGLLRPGMAAAIWSTTLLPFVAAGIAATDMLLTAFESLAVLGYLCWRVRESQRGLWLMWLSFGVAFMTKGPPALLPLLAILVFEASFVRDSRARGLFPIAPVVAFAVLAFWWYVYLLGRDPTLWRYFLVIETLDRVATAAHDRNPGWRGLLNVYGPVLLAGTLPFVPLLIWSILRRKVAAARRAANVLGCVSRRFLYLWMGVPFAVFAVAQSRLPLYLLPLTVPFALTTAWHLEAAEISTRLIRNTAIAGAVLLLALRFASAHLPTQRDARALARELSAAVNLDDYDEIIFVDSHRQAYGLEFYTGKQIAMTHSDAGLRPAGSSEPLCEKLARSEAPLLLVPEASVDRYASEPAWCNRTRFVRVGHLRRFALLGQRRIDTAS